MGDCCILCALPAAPRSQNPQPEGAHPHFSPRSAFGKDGQQLVLLLLGGDKSTQASDVARAQASWKAYREDKRCGKTK